MSDALHWWGYINHSQTDVPHLANSDQLSMMAVPA
jgi:hypothetical protein